MSNNNTTTATDPQNPASATALRVAFGFIAVFAIVGNSLLLLVLVRSKSMLKLPYNVLILSLGIVDFLTGKYS